MEEITITRALAELKLLDSRINKKTSESDFAFLLSKKNKNNLNTDTLTTNAKASFQSIVDLIKRRQTLKSAIILSNAHTRVKLNGEDLTVAEVIECKQLVDLYKGLLLKLKQNRETVVNQVERNNQQLELDLQKLLEINFGKSSNAKTNTDDIENISKTYREQNKSEMLDCVNIDSKIKEVEELINKYETETNFVLSESNATTKIKV
jgi:hypothetical protein